MYQSIVIWLVIVRVQNALHIVDSELPYNDETLDFTSLSARPKTNPSVDHFQYCVYWKWYTRRMRSGDETIDLLAPATNQ